MDLSWIFASVLVLVVAFSVSALRRRVYKLEDVVLRLQDRVAELSAAPADTPSDAPASRIDIEPFVD